MNEIKQKNGAACGSYACALNFCEWYEFVTFLYTFLYS